MNVYYKIVEIWKAERLMVVRYYTDILTEEKLAVDTIRKEDGSPIRCRTDISMSIPFIDQTKEELEKHLFLSAPLHLLKSLENVETNSIDTKLEIVNELFNKPCMKTEHEILELGQLATKIDPNRMRCPTENEIQTILNKINPKYE